MRILITGPQGSGKTTHAQILTQKLRLTQIDAGEILRELAEIESTEGKSVKKDLEVGKFVEDRIIANLIREKVSNLGGGNFVMDGYPRTMESLKLYNPDFDQVFYLEVPDQEVEKRLLLRGREDDKPEIIQKRLKLFHQVTEPVLDYYRQQHKVIKVDADRSIEVVAEDIEKKVREGLQNGSKW